MKLFTDFDEYDGFEKFLITDDDGLIMYKATPDFWNENSKKFYNENKEKMFSAIDNILDEIDDYEFCTFKSICVIEDEKSILVYMPLTCIEKTESGYFKDFCTGPHLHYCKNKKTVKKDL